MLYSIDMQVIKSTDWADGVADLSARIIDALTSNKKVLWLLSGGSNIDASVKIMEQIPDELSVGLIVGLIDERFGLPGHQDSNMQQLLTSGFRAKHAKLIPILQPGLDLERTVEEYEKAVIQALRQADVSIAQLGIGEDCHIAGILPNSAAALETENFIKSYKSDPYTRITLTFPGLEKIDICYAFAFGENKKQALNEIINESHSIVEKPGTILRDLDEVYIYSDQAGEEGNDE